MVNLLRAMLNAPLFALVACRMSGIVLVAPIYSSVSIPARVKVALVFMISLVLFPFAVHYAGAMPTNLVGFVPLFLSELGMGLVMGLAGAIVIAAARMAGAFASQQIGLAMANTAAPDTGGSSTAISVFLSMLALLLLLTMNGHHWFIRAVAMSYRKVPLGEIRWQAALLSAINAEVADTFVIALRLVAPIVGIMFLVNIMMALIAKTAPQIHILIVGYPIKMFAGLILLTLTFPMVWAVIRGSFDAFRLFLWHMIGLF